MGGLDPHDQPLVAEGHVGRGLGLHVLEVLLGPDSCMPPATMLRNAKTRVRAIDDAGLEVREVAAAGGAGVSHAGHPRADGETVGVNAVVAGIRPSLARSRVNVNMNIDQPRRHEKPGDIHGFERGGRVDRGFHGRDLALRDGDVANRADLVSRVDDMPTMKQ